MIIELTNYKSLLQGKFTPLCSVDTSNDVATYEVYWECDYCKDRAVMDLNEGNINEYIISCSCQSGYSMGEDLWIEMSEYAKTIILNTAGITYDEIKEADTNEEQISMWSKVKSYFSSFFS